MFIYYKNSIKRRVNSIRCSFIKNNNTLLPPNRDTAYLTIFHDFEADYSLLTTKENSYNAVSNLLNLEKKFNVSATYNTVGLLIKDVPELIYRIKSEGHEIASHSFSHKVLNTLNKSEMVKDLKQTRESFKSLHLDLKGLRSPQSKWNFKLLHVLLDQGVTWNAENDTARFPYVIVKRNNKRLIRMPITMDDWLYKSQGTEPKQMYDRLIATVDAIADQKIYGSIGFHPWIQGEDERRLRIFENFLKYVSEKKDIKIRTFSQICELFSN